METMLSLLFKVIWKEQERVCFSGYKHGANNAVCWWHHAFIGQCFCSSGVKEEKNYPWPFNIALWLCPPVSILFCGWDIAGLQKPLRRLLPVLTRPPLQVVWYCVPPPTQKAASLCSVYCFLSRICLHCFVFCFFNLFLQMFFEFFCYLI